jgi:hypothetical protein
VHRTKVITEPVFDEATGMSKIDNKGNPIVEDFVMPVMDYSGLRFEVVDIDNVAMDWSVQDFRKSWVILREYIDPETYLNRVDNLGYRKLEDEQIENMIRVDQSFMSIASEVDRRSSTDNMLHRGKIEILHYYGKGYYKGVRQDVLISVARNMNKHKNSATHLYVHDPVPFSVKPFVILRFKPKRGELLGRGLGEQLAGLQEELNITRNQRIDNLAMELNGGWIVAEDSVEHIEDLISKPNQIIRVTDTTNPPMKIPRQPLPTDAFAHEQTIQMEAAKVSASEDIMRGSMPRKETATVGMLLNTNAGQRLEAIVFRMGDDGLRSLGDLLKNMIIDFTPSNDPIILKLSEDEVDKFGQELGEYMQPGGFIAVPAGILNKAMFASSSVAAIEGDNRARSQQLLQMMQITGQLILTGWRDRQGGKVFLDMTYLIKEYARLNKMPELNKMFVNIPAEVVQAQEAQQVALNEMAKQSAGGAVQSIGQQQEQGGAIPAEVGGQVMEQPVSEAVAQQSGVEQEIDETLAEL